METKRCYKCKEQKSVNDFYKDRTTSSGLCSKCKECKKAYCKEYEQRPYVKESRKTYRESPEGILVNTSYRSKSEVKERNKIKAKERRKQNLDKYKAMSRRYYQNNLDRERKRRAAYMRKRRKEDPSFNLSCRLRGAMSKIRECLIENKEIHTFKALGCDIKFLREFIEEQFEPGMSWNESDLWHLDHIIPLKYGNPDDEEMLKRAHWTNLQPKWAHENLAKCNRYIG